jgi:hypothetical protein
MASVKMTMLVAQIARMRCAGIKDVAIARALNFSNSGLQRILRLQAYQEFEQAIFAGQLSKMDQELSKNVDLMHQHMRQAVPVALRTIVETAMQRRDLRAALAASQDILNRDPDRNFVSARDSVGATSNQTPGLPNVLIEMISKDADGVATAVANKFKKENLGKTDA